MKGFNISRLITLMAVIAMGCSLNASAQTQIAFRITADNFVHGVNQNATFNVFMNANAKVKSFVMTFDLASSGGMDFTGVAADAINEVAAAYTADANITKTGVSGQSLTLNVKSAVGKYAMEATDGEILIAKIFVSIPPAMVGANNLPYMLANSTAFNETTLGQSAWASVTPAYNVVQQIPIAVFTKRAVAAGSLFIQKGAETSKVYTLTCTGGDASKPVTYAITTQPTKGTVTVAGDKATYTVTDTETEFYDANADTFQFTASDATTGTSAPATVTVSYRANPPAVITALDGMPAIGSTFTVPEVDGNGDPSFFTLGINATDDPIVTPNGVAKIEWSVALGDETNAWTIDVPVTNYDPAHPSQDSTITLTLPGYGTITSSPLLRTKDFIVTATVTDTIGVTSTATWTVKVTDMPQLDFNVEADNFVHGVDQHATINIYMNANAKVKSFVMTFDLANSGGMDFVGTPADAIKEVTAAFSADANFTKTGVSGQSLTFNVKSAVGKYAMEATGGEILIAQILVAIPQAMIGVNNMPYKLAASFAFNEQTLGQSAWGKVTPPYNVVQQIPVPVFTKRAVAAGSLFIQKGAETSKVYTLTSTGGDASKPVTYAITTQPTKGTVTIAGDKATYTVTDTNTEFYDNAADTFQFTASDATTGTSAPATVTVSYRANPPAVITALGGQPALGSTLTVPEVDGNGAPSFFTLGINATDDPIVTPNGVAKIEWAVALGDETNAWTIDAQVSNYDPAQPSQDSTITITLPGYDTITGSPRPANKDFTVTASVTDVTGTTSTATWTVKVTDVDRPQGAPQAITGFTPAAPKTGDNVTINFIGTPAADPDGDAISYVVEWISGTKFLSGPSLPSTITQKGETWTASVVSVTSPYGAEFHSFSVTADVTIGNTAPVVANGSMYLIKSVEAEQTFTLTATDADPADVFSYAVVAAPTKGTVVINGNVATYTVTDPSQEFFGAAVDTFTFVANDGTDDSNIATVTVAFRENAFPNIVALPGQPALGTVVDVPEVDATGTPSVFTLGINASDSNIGSPFGVKKIAWAVNGNPAGWVVSTPSTVYANIPSQDNSVSITLPGYETIAGAGRPASQDFTVTITVWDAMDVESTATWTIRVGDVDRPASAPTTLEILVDGAAIADGGEARVAQAITLNADGSVDPDGDVVTGYDYTWANDKTVSTDIATRAKGETWTVTAKAKTTAYGAEAISTESSTKSVVIVNTPPALALVDPLPWTGATALLEDCATTTLPLTDFVTPTDDDVADLEAGRSYTIAFTQTDAGSFTYDPTQKTVAFTPAIDFNGDVTFTVTANDGTADSEPIDVVFTVLPVNDAPSIAIADFYATPNDCNEELIEWGPFDVNMGGGTDENPQGLQEFTLVELVDPDGILGGFGWIYNNGSQGSRVTINFGLLESAKDKVGAEAIVRFTIQDGGDVANGGVDTSAVTEFKIVLGAMPWYPLYQLTDAKLAENPAFADYTSYVVRIKDGDAVLAQNTLMKTDSPQDMLFTPAKYLSSDVPCSGLLPSATAGENKPYTVEILPRDESGVVNDPAKVLLDTVLVPFYAAPTAASFANADDAVITPDGNTVTFNIKAPLASTYTLKVYSILLGAAPKLVFERNNVKFQPRADGMIIPVTTLLAEFLTPGEYIADLSSTNPAGASAAVLDTAMFTIAAAGQSTLSGMVNVPEVDANGNPSIATLGVTAAAANAVAPHGVKRITWEIVGNHAGWAIDAPSTEYPNAPIEEDSTVNITLPGYEAIAGAGRPANQDFFVTVTVTDAMNVDTSATWTIRVSDVDRAASDPTTLNILVAGAAIADGGEAKVAQAITLTADGSVDPDGDAVTGYDFTWANDKNASTDIATRAKGETWTVTAKAKTTAYGAEVVSTEGSTTSVVIANTPPVLALVDPLPWTGATALLEDCATTTLPLTDFVTPTDDDVADLDAGRSYTIAFPQTDAGSLTYDPTQKTVAFTPAVDFNGYVSFTVTANDGAADSAPIDVTFTVLPVNDAPVVAVTNFYALPDDCTSELITWGPFDVNMGGGVDENVQVLRGFTQVEQVDPDGILGSFSQVSYNGSQGSQVTLNFSLLETAKDKVGSEAIVRFTIQDDGGVANGGSDTSTVAEFKIVLHAAPLAVTVTNLPRNPGDSAPITLAFNANLDLDVDVLRSAIALRFAGEEWAFTLSRTDARNYTLDGLLDNAWTSGEFELTIDLVSLSGRANNATYTVKWSYACDLIDYAWQPGWNAICLPFTIAHPQTIAMLLDAPCYRMADDKYVISNDVPLQTPLWVFRENHQNSLGVCGGGEPAPYYPPVAVAGLLPANPPLGLPDLPADQWSFVGIGQEVATLPNGHTAWEWRGAKYVQATALYPSQVYWIYKQAAQ